MIKIMTRKGYNVLFLPIHHMGRRNKKWELKLGRERLGRDRSVHGAGMPSRAGSAEFEVLALDVIVQTDRAVKPGFLVS